MQGTREGRCDGLFEPPPPLPARLSSLLRAPDAEIAKADGDCDDGVALEPIDDSIVDLRLARFLSTLPARWCSRQRVVALKSSRTRLSLCESVLSARGATILSEGESEGLPPPTLALVVGGGREEVAPPPLASDESDFQVLAAFGSGGIGDFERRAEELASRLGSEWSWRPLSPPTADGAVVCQLFPRRPSSSFLVASDYDHTLIDDNSDTRVVSALGASDVLEDLYETKKLGWTEAVDGALAAGAARVFERKGDAEGVVLSSAASAPCSQALREAILSVCSRGGENADLAIFSDANDVFIERGLCGNGDVNVVAVATNPARFVDVSADPSDPSAPSYRRLSLSRATDRYGRHGCLRCPQNLCKGELLSKLLVCGPRAPYGRGVAYLGDGSNDVCPAVRCLGPDDAALARERYGESGKEAAFGAAVLPSSSSEKKKARLLCGSVVGWSTQDELARALLSEARKRGAVSG